MATPKMQTKDGFEFQLVSPAPLNVFKLQGQLLHRRCPQAERYKAPTSQPQMHGPPIIIKPASMGLPAPINFLSQAFRLA